VAEKKRKDARVGVDTAWCEMIGKCNEDLWFLGCERGQRLLGRGCSRRHNVNWERNVQLQELKMVVVRVDGSPCRLIELTPAAKRLRVPSWRVALDIVRAGTESTWRWETA